MNDERNGNEPEEALGSDEPKAPHVRDADAVVKRYVIGSMAAGLVMLPGVDALAVVGVQLKMLHSLCAVYGIPFSEKAGRSIISSLIGGLGASAMARGTFGSLVKLVPIVGPLVGGVAMPVFAGATTYAVGKVFIRHFEGGGSIVDFSAERVRRDFMNLYSDGFEVASSINDKDSDVSVAKEQGLG